MVRSRHGAAGPGAGSAAGRAAGNGSGARQGRFSRSTEVGSGFDEKRGFQARNSSQSAPEGIFGLFLPKTATAGRFIGTAGPFTGVAGRFSGTAGRFIGVAGRIIGAAGRFNHTAGRSSHMAGWFNRMAGASSRTAERSSREVKWFNRAAEYPGHTARAAAFQSLKKVGAAFPKPGKFLADFSKAWNADGLTLPISGKSARFRFQSLEHQHRRGCWIAFVSFCSTRLHCSAGRGLWFVPARRGWPRRALEPRRPG